MHPTETPLLTEPHYLGSIYHFAGLVTHKNIVFEQYSFFQKSTCRNRCYIAASNGSLLLSIPLAGGRHQNCPDKEVRIDNSYNWQKHHWHSIESAYRSSAYFMYYEDALYPFYHNKYPFLLNYTIGLTQTLCKLLKIDAEFTLTQHYQKNHPPNTLNDLREQTGCKPGKKLPQNFTPPTYYQLFAEKNGFMPNLSIIDLLFSQGPNSLQLLCNALNAKN